MGNSSVCRFRKKTSSPGISGAALKEYYRAFKYLMKTSDGRNAVIGVANETAAQLKDASDVLAVYKLLVLLADRIKSPADMGQYAHNAIRLVQLMNDNNLRRRQDEIRQGVAE